MLTDHEIEQRFSELNYPRSEIIQFVKWFRDKKALTLAQVCAKKDARIMDQLRERVAELEAARRKLADALSEANDRIGELEREVDAERNEQGLPPKYYA